MVEGKEKRSMTQETGTTTGPAPASVEAKPPCKLTGTDGNVFSIIGQVRRVLIRAGQDVRAHEFCERAFVANSYDAVLRLCFEYVEVH